MKKTFNFGKIAYCRKGVRNNPVTVDVRLDDKDGKSTFSACGNIWNHIKSDIVSGGQNLDEIAKYVKSPLFKKIYRFWELYHLNDMHPECEHQRAAGWGELASKKVTIYKWNLDDESNKKQRDAQRAAETALKAGETFTPTTEQAFFANLPWSIKTYDDPNPPKYYKQSSGLFSFNRSETKTLGWLSVDEYAYGLLHKPCPVCGYEYGTSWLYMPIPEDDLNSIKELLEIA